MNDFRAELTRLLNRFSKENASNTPDYVLAKFIEQSLNSFDEAVKTRDAWYGVHLEPGNKYFEN